MSKTRAKKPNVISPKVTFECPKSQVCIRNQSLVTLDGKPVVFEESWNGSFVYVLPAVTVRHLLYFKKKMQRVTDAINADEETK